MKFKLRDPVSGLTHLFGMFLSIAGLVLLVYYASMIGTVWHVVSFSIFGASLILLYAASAFYHMLPVPEKWQKILQNIDHMMIYILIAGTYTPICLVPLRGAWGWSLFGVIWACAILGVAFHTFYKAPRWLSTLIYVLMGWLVAIAFWPLVKNVQWAGVLWLMAGGFFYMVGAVIYALKWPFKNAKWFGFHEIFHLFVLAGSFCHFWLVFKYFIHL
ncbi:MAG TPA: hemolysin [Firmicutes bacterium]|jgi:hemolysin III|nr:hemolysin [Bacillota bacterium]